jgi:heme/copper-type cytochrome/quinol oxidase subunit 2
VKPLWFVLALAVLWVVSVALVNAVWSYLRRRERDAFKRPREW